MNSHQGQRGFAGQVAVVTGAGSGSAAPALNAWQAGNCYCRAGQQYRCRRPERNADHVGRWKRAGCGGRRERRTRGWSRCCPGAGDSGRADHSGQRRRNHRPQGSTGLHRARVAPRAGGQPHRLLHPFEAVIPAMRVAGGGSIVQIASIAGHIGYGFSSYTAAKGGVLALTRQLAGELAQDGIRINSVSPGVVRTGLNRDTLGTPAIAGATIQNIPLGRLGEPRDIAAAVCFLAGPEASFVTGTDLVVDGGMVSKIHWPAGARELQNFHAEVGSTR